MPKKSRPNKKSQILDIASSKIRKRHNEDLLQRMKNGEPLTNYDAMDSWFPTRPLVEKDKEAMARLYGETLKKGLTVEPKKRKQSKNSTGKKSSKSKPK